MNFLARLWARRWVRVVAKTLLVLVALRALVSLGAPFVLSRVAARFELTTKYDELTLSVFGGTAQITGLVVGERSAAKDAPALLAVEYGLVDVSMLSLLKGKLHVERAELDDVHARVERRADGSLPWLVHFGLDRPAEPEPAPEPEQLEPPEPPGPLDFRSPVRVDAVRAVRVGIRFVDAAVAPAIDEELVCQLRVSGVGIEEGVASFEASATSPRLLGSARAQGRVRGGVRALACDVDYALDRFHAAPLAGLLRPLGLEPIADAVSARGAATIAVEPAEGSSELCRAAFRVHSVRVEADGEAAFALGELAIGPAWFSAREFRLDEVRVADLTLAAHRSANGRLGAAGFELVPVEAQRAADSTAPPAPLLFPTLPLDVQRLRLERWAVSLDDHAVEPATRLEARLDSFAAVTDAADAPGATAKTFSAHFVAPGIFAEAALDGRVKFADPTLAFDATLSVFGLEAERLRPHLAALGLEPEFVKGRFTARIAASAEIADGKLGAGALTLGPVALVDGEEAASPSRELFALEHVEIAGLGFDPLANRVDVASVESSGLRAGALRDEQGTWHFAGVRTLDAPRRAAPASPPAAPSAPSVNAPSSVGALPELHVARLATFANTLRFVDRAVTPPIELATEPLEATVSDLVLGARKLDENRATLRCELAVPGVLESATLEGELRAQAGGAGARFASNLAAVGVTPGRLAPYLAALGLEPDAERLDATTELRVTVAREDGAWNATLQVAGAKIGDGARELASLGLLEASDARVGAHGALAASGLTLTNAHVVVERDADGRLHALGLRLAAAPLPGAPSDASEPSRVGAEPTATAAWPRIDVGQVVVDGLALDWSDAAVAQPVATRLAFAGSIAPLRLGVDAAAEGGDDEACKTRFTFVGELGPELPRASLVGSALLDPELFSLDARVECERLRAGVLAAYLPPGVAVELESGIARLELTLNSARVLALRKTASGSLVPGEAGRAVELEVRDVELRDGGTSLAKLGRFALDVSRLDPADGVVEIESLALAGAELDVRRGADGSVHAAGIALVPRPSVAADPAVVEQPQAAAPPQATVSSVALTRFAIANADVELARLSFVDESFGASAEPVVLAARAKLADVLLQGGDASSPPIRIDVAGSLAPFCERWNVALALGDADGEPMLDARLALDGVNGEALTRVLPKLATLLDGSELANGSLRASAKTRFHAPRKPNRAPDLASPFGAELELGPFEFRATLDGEVLAGLDAGRVEITKVDPRSGDVAVRSIELVKPRGRVLRDAEGIHVLGLTLRVPTASAADAANEPATTAAPERVAEPTEASSPQPRLASTAQTPPAKAGAELSVDRFTIAGLDLVITDATATPPMFVPLVDLDFELRKFSTRALTEPKAFYFNAFVTAGTVNVPRRIVSDSLLEGIAEGVGDVLAGADHELVTLEARPLFDEVAVAGRITLFPEIRGWVNLGVSSLELTNFRGLAQSFGLDVGDGVLDQTVRVRLQGEQGFSIESRSTFSYLSLSEPAGGPISRYLALPASLDTVLFVMKDLEDQHKVPVDVRMGWDGLSTSDLVSAALGAATSMIATAVASAPLRLLSGLGGLFGDDDEVPPTDDTVAVEYGAGVTTFEERERTALDPLVQRFVDDERFVFAVQHRFSKADFERATRLANPSVDDCRDLSARLRGKKAELLRRREELAARTRVDYAVGRDAAASAATVELRAIDRELGFNEDALDRVHELLRPGAERRRDQRTKAALVAIAIERVARLKQELVERGIDPARVEVRSLKTAIDPTLESGRVSLTPHKRK